MSINNTESFRTKNTMSKVLDLQNKNPNKAYCLARVDETYDPNGSKLDQALADGWEIEVDDASVLDFRSSAPDNSNEQSLRKKPLTKKGKGESEFVVISIDKDKLDELEKARAKRTLDRYIASSTGRKVVKKGASLKITDSETNESNMNNQSEV